MQGDAATTLDPAVVAAQRHNISRMSDDKLTREWRIVTGFRERPPIRVAYIDELRNEICARGLPAPVDVLGRTGDGDGIGPKDWER